LKLKFKEKKMKGSDLYKKKKLLKLRCCRSGKEEGKWWKRQELLTLCNREVAEDER